MYEADDSASAGNSCAADAPGWHQFIQEQMVQTKLIASHSPRLWYTRTRWETDRRTTCWPLIGDAGSKVVERVPLHVRLSLWVG
jgi:hypothetical protein